MKKLFLIFSITIFSNNISAQSMKEISGTYSIDSCLVIAKQHPGWKIADTLDIRLLAPKLKGFAYLTSTRYEGNYVEVELRQPLRKLIAADTNGNGPAY